MSLPLEARARCARLTLILLTGLWVAGCDVAGSACDDPTDPASCGCAVTCAAGEWCIDGRCVGGDTADNCGPAGDICAFGEVCLEGACVCDAALNSDDPRACGCPAVDCSTLQDQEICVDGQCTCDPNWHTENDVACGCPPVDCGVGFICKDSQCECVPEEHLTDSANCGCNGACGEGKICSAGRCVCPNGTLPCGDACVPLGYQCCDAERGDACPPGNVCEETPAGESACRSTDRRPCHDNQGRLIGSCAADESCAMGPVGLRCVRPDEVACRDEGGLVQHTCPQDALCVSTEHGITCHPRHMVPCYSEAGYTGACGPGTRCGPGGLCLREDAKLCADGATICEVDDFCEWTGEGYTCRPNGTQPCYEGGEFRGWCEFGEACERSAAGQVCRPAGTVPCYRDGLFERACEQGEICEETREGHACRPQGHAPCFDDGFFVGACGPGFQCAPGGCVPAGSQQCGAQTICPPHHVCERGAAGFTCRPQSSVPCYRNGAYAGFCELGELCEEARRGQACREPGTNPCYDRQGYYTRTCPAGWACIADGSDCMPPGGSICPNERSYCRPGFTCYATDTGGNGCIPNGRDPCLDNGRLMTRDNVYTYCGPGSHCDEDRFQNPGSNPCVR